MSGPIVVFAGKALDRLPICALAVPLLASLHELQSYIIVCFVCMAYAYNFEILPIGFCHRIRYVCCNTSATIS